MKKLLLSLFLSLMFASITWADDTQTVTVDGADTGKTVKQITFNGDKIILHYTDNTTYEGEDLSLVVITFNNATGISKPNQVLDTNAVWYDLSGRRLSDSQQHHGIIIKNGKKIWR